MIRHILLIAAAIAAEGWLVVQRAYVHATSGVKDAAVIGLAAAFIAADIFLSLRKAARARKARGSSRSFAYAPTTRR